MRDGGLEVIFSCISARETIPENGLGPPGISFLVMDFIFGPNFGLP